MREGSVGSIVSYASVIDVHRGVVNGGYGEVANGGNVLVGFGQ